MTNEELTARLLELDERATRHTEQIKTAFNQIGEIKMLAESVQQLAIATKLIGQEMKGLSGRVDNLAEDVEEIKERPGKRWDSAVNLVFTVIATAALTLLLAWIGLK